MPAAILVTTLPNGKSARRIAQDLVRRRLAACVNVVDGATSFYRWKGRVERSRESILVIKSTLKNFRKIEAFLRAAHPYELPEFLELPVRRGSKEYVKWVEASAR